VTYEEKMRMLAWCKPEKKDRLLERIVRGERSVNIQDDEDMFFRVNVDRLPMADQINRRVEKFSPLAEDMKEMKKYLADPVFGKTKNKKMRYLGEIPESIYFTHPWFSPLLPKEERDANIRRFFNEFPAFRAGDKKI
jgi:hypothetical protein